MFIFSTRPRARYPPYSSISAPRARTAALPPITTHYQFANQKTTSSTVNNFAVESLAGDVFQLGNRLQDPAHRARRRAVETHTALLPLFRSAREARRTTSFLSRYRTTEQVAQWFDRDPTGASALRCWWKSCVVCLSNFNTYFSCLLFTSNIFTSSTQSLIPYINLFCTFAFTSLSTISFSPFLFIYSSFSFSFFS